MIRGKCVVHLLLRSGSALALHRARLDVHALWQRVPYISGGRRLINVHIQQKALKRVGREWNRKEGRFCFQLYCNPCFYISPYNLKACRHVFGDSERCIYLPPDLFIFLFVNLTDFLSFLQIFFVVEFCLEAQRRLKVFFQIGMKLNWTGMKTKTKCSLFALCLATPHEYSELHWVLVCFSISVFLSFSLSGHGPFFPTYTRTQEYRNTHT